MTIERIKHVGLLVILPGAIGISLLLIRSRPPSPETVWLPSHFSGVGTWVYYEISEGKIDISKLKGSGLSFVIVKTNDGNKWIPQLNGSTVKKIHENGMRCYAYGTLYLRSWNSVKTQLVYAIKCLEELGCDGYVLDDVFIYGSNRQRAKFLFSKIRAHLRHCSKCRGKTLAFSTFPHLLVNYRLPWRVAMRYTDYFLPQAYWEAWGLTPVEALVYSQASWDGYRAFRRASQNCQLVPALPAYELWPRMPESVKQASSQNLDKGLALAYKHYRGVAVFRYSTAGRGDWGVIKKWGWQFRAPHIIKDPSLFHFLR